jgi:hypothetical protein
VAVRGVVPGARHVHTAVEYEGAMWVFGGYGSSSTYYNDTHRFSLGTYTPPSTSPPPHDPTTLRLRSALVHPPTDHDVWHVMWRACVRAFAGGVRAEEHKWECVLAAGRSCSPVGRHSHVAVVHADSMYVFGGISRAKGSAELNDLHRFAFRKHPPPHALAVPPRGVSLFECARHAAFLFIYIYIYMCCHGPWCHVVTQETSGGPRWRRWRRGAARCRVLGGVTRGCATRVLSTSLAASPAPTPLNCGASHSVRARTLSCQSRARRPCAVCRACRAPCAVWSVRF